jgi:hypothetical protein
MDETRSDDTDRHLPGPVGIRAPNALSSAVSWSAILAGSAGAAAFSLILLTLGTGLGLSALSPWTSRSVHASTFGVAAIVWICVTQILSCGLGGYLAGRLRRRWAATDLDEVYFRDTAHGFLSWAVATLFTAVLLTSITSTLSELVQTRPQTDGRVAVNSVAPALEAPLSLSRGNASTAENIWPVGYFVDSLFRQPPPATASSPDTTANTAHAEVTRIFLNSVAARVPLSAADSAYVSHLIVRQTGLSFQAAQARTDETYALLQHKLESLDTAARAAADKARKAAVHISLWLFVSLLMGAFSASLMAVWGGRQRDM